VLCLDLFSSDAWIPAFAGMTEEGLLSFPQKRESSKFFGSEAMRMRSKTHLFQLTRHMKNL